MKLAIQFIILILISSLQSQAGGGSAPSCQHQTILSCQTVGGQSLIDITEIYCTSDDYDDYVEGRGLKINSPSGLFSGRVDFMKVPASWKLSTKETGNVYTLNEQSFDIELYIGQNKRGTILLSKHLSKVPLLKDDLICH